MYFGCVANVLMAKDKAIAERMDLNFIYYCELIVNILFVGVCDEIVDHSG